jgi:hypothetical protein
VSSKVRIFAWKLSQECLATQCNRKIHTLTENVTCRICGVKDESDHHAVVKCTKAVSLRFQLRQYWRLPDEEQLCWNGPHWLLLLLNSVDAEVKAYILLLFWRAWHLRNDVMHGDGKATILGSSKFLTTPSQTANKRPRSISKKEKRRSSVTCQRFLSLRNRGPSSLWACLFELYLFRKLM